MNPVTLLSFVLHSSTPPQTHRPDPKGSKTGVVVLLYGPTDKDEDGHGVLFSPSCPSTVDWTTSLDVGLRVGGIN